MLTLNAAASAQGTIATTGSVTGHVICADTQRPARLANVVLEPMVDLQSPVLKPKPGEYTPEGSVALTPTSLDGSFTIPNVRPGKYYVIAEQEGYMSPLSEFSREDLNHPDDAMMVKIARLLTPVSVEAGRSSQVEVRLLRGAAVSGTVHFDDGTPAIQIMVSLLHRNKEGKWVQTRVKPIAQSFGSNQTDDRGAYRITGVPAGEYLVKATLARYEIVVDHVFAESGSSAFLGSYTLNVYPNDVMRSRDATPIKLSEGEESGGNDIDLPVSKLYSVSGSVAQGDTAQTINAAHLSLVYADDGSAVADADVSKEDGLFHFPYVPAGNLLKASQVRDVIRTEVPNCKNCTPPSHTEAKTVQTFGDASQPLLIQGDLSNVVVHAPPAAKHAPALP